MKQLILSVFFGLTVMAVLAGVNAATGPTLPPTFLSAVATYNPDGTYNSLFLSKNRFLSCKDALDDTMSAIARAAELQPEGARTIGQCIPIQTYSARDLIVNAEPSMPLNTYPVPKLQ